MILLGTRTVPYGKMGEYRISCVIKEHGIITSVGINGRTHPIMDVVNWIVNREHTFFTFEGGHIATVYAKHNYWGRWFLTTQPDGVLEDNLGFLPECS